MKTIQKLIDKSINESLNITRWSFIFLVIISIRIFIEFFLAKHVAVSSSEVLMEYLHNLFFFLIAFLTIWIILSVFLKENPKKLSFLLSFASIMIILPPIIDMIKTGGEVYWSFYVFGGPSFLFDQFITFFGKLPSGIVYFGTKIIFILAVLGTLMVVWTKTKSFLKSFLASLSVYLAFFILGTFPSWLSIIYHFFARDIEVAAIKGFHVAQLLVFPYPIFGYTFDIIKYSLAYNLNLVFYLITIVLLMVLMFLYSKEKLKALIKNFRFEQVFYHSGLFFCGLGLGYLAFPESLYINFFSLTAIGCLLAAIWLAWKTSVIINDIYDFKIDVLSNPNRPLQKSVINIREYVQIGVITFILSILGGLVVGAKFAVMLFVYQALSWAYSAPPFRLKRFLGLATFFSSLASVLVLFMGFILFSGPNDLQGLSPRIIFLLIITYTLCLPIKDFKDIKGDKEAGIRTVPVIFGEERGRLIVGTSFFISYILSVFFLNAWDLFWWALLFGAIAFWVINNKKIASRQLLGWNLGIVLVYGVILVKIVFL